MPTNNWRKFSVKKPLNFPVIFLILGSLCLAAALGSLLLGAAELTPRQILLGLAAGPDSGVAGTIVWYARVPRTAAALLTGCALAVSGCIIQAVLGNPLASPGIIGVNAGAGLGVTILCAAGILSGWAIAAGSFLGALAAALLVTSTARRVGASRSTVILGGVAVNSFLSAISEAITSLVPDAAALSVDFRIGGFGSLAIGRVLPAGVLIVGSLVLAMTLHNELDLLRLGEETAQGLGLRVRQVRNILLLCAAVLAGSSVSMAGLLGFVGLVVPHMARFLVGSQSKYLLPAAGLLGAGLVTLCDLAGRLIIAPYELSAGIFMALIGGPFFLHLLLRRKGGRHHD